METELWPNLYRECERRGVPMVLANARLSAKSVARYRRLGNLARGIFSATSLIAAQTPVDAERFVSIGAPRDRTCVAGNIKFDLEIAPGVMDAGRALRSFFGSSRPVWIAGSTHAGEEALVLAAHAELPPDALLLLVPRHPDRFDAVAQLLSQGGWKFARRSSGAAPGAEVRVVLVDSVGELAALYAAGRCGVRRRQSRAHRRPQSPGAGGTRGAGADRTVHRQRPGDCAAAADARGCLAGGGRARAGGCATAAVIRSRGAAAHGGLRTANRGIESRQRRAIARPH